MAILITFVDILPYVVLLLAVIGIVIFYVYWEKKQTQSIPDDKFFMQILEALGSIDNIKQATKEHRRVQLELASVEHVNMESLKALELSAFFTGKKVTLLMNEQGKRLLDHIKILRKEER